MMIRFFQFAAPGYDLLTDQDLWRRAIVGMLEYAPLQVDRVLDLGCGPGVSTHALACANPALRLVGIDREPAMIRRAQRHFRRRYADLSVSFLCADAARLPFADESVDLVVGHSFLYLLARPRSVLCEVRRVLRPGGRLVLMEPARPTCLLAMGRVALEGTGQALRAPWAASRFLISLALWRLAGRIHGFVSPEQVGGLFEAVGLRQIGCHPTLGGLGLHCVGEA